MQKRSTLRKLIEERIGEPVEDWVAERRQQGLSVEEAWLELRDATGVLISSRTLYLWIEQGKSEVAS